MVTTRAASAQTPGKPTPSTRSTLSPSPSPSPSPPSTEADATVTTTTTAATTVKPRRGRKPKTMPPPSTSTTSTPTTARAAGADGGGWSHTPRPLTLLWLAVSLPLVAWDTAYVLGRPHTMEGGAAYWPLWVPYKLYGTVDHVYGWRAWDARLGFTAAQGALNAVETALYLWYVALWWRGSGGEGAARRAGAKGGWEARVLVGRRAALAVLVAQAAAVMTLSKTVLYWLNEYFGGFDNIGHNTAIDLIFLWIIPNGLWLIFPSYMIWSLSKEIFDGLIMASASVKEE